MLQLSAPPSGDASLVQRLLGLQTDRRALEAEVTGVVQAQQMQIRLLEREAAQLARSSTAEQRLNSHLATNSVQARLNRARTEQTALMNHLEDATRRSAVLSHRLEAAKEKVARLRQDVDGPPKKIATGRFQTVATSQVRLQRFLVLVFLMGLPLKFG